jgi:hypothetical protein
MKYADPPSFADPEKAAYKLLEIANATEAVQDGRIYIETINGHFLFKEGGTPEEYSAGLWLAIDRGWLWKHESGHVCEVRTCRCGPVHLTSENEIGRLLRRAYGSTDAGVLVTFQISHPDLSATALNSRS